MNRPPRAIQRASFVDRVAALTLLALERKMHDKRLCGFLVALAGAVGGIAMPAHAETIYTDYGITVSGVTIANDRIGNSRLFSGPNTDRFRIQAFVWPSPDSDASDYVRPSDGQVFRSTNGSLTTVTVSHPSGFPGGSTTQSLVFSGLTSGFGGGFNEYGRSFDLASAEVAARVDDWASTPFVITIQNPRSGNSPVVVTAPDYVKDALPPFLENVAVTGGGLTPALSWTIPDTGVAPSSISVQVRRIDAESADGTRVTSATLVHAVELAPTTTSYSFEGVLFSNRGFPGFPAGLEEGKKYEIAVILSEREGGLQNGRLLGRSRTFFEFTPLPDGTGNVAVYLPSVGPDGAWKFNVEVKAGETIAIDPFVAIGYEYQIGAGDPLFRSVTLPYVGDDKFDLYLFDGTDWIFSALLNAGDEYFFGGNGVDRFRILGIETSAGLDPTSTTAFITQLTFMGDGRFTGTMTALTAEVPEPGTTALFGAAIAGIALLRRRRRRLSLQ